MTDNVVDLATPFKGHLDPNKVLEGAKEKLSDVLLLGWTKSGDFYLACSTGDLKEISFLLETARWEVADRVRKDSGY